MLDKHLSIIRAIGYIRITVRDLDGNILEQTVLKNTITNLLFNLYRDALAGDLGNIEDLKIERMMKELQSDLADQVRAGDITPEFANEWANMKADQWALGLS